MGGPGLLFAPRSREALLRGISTVGELVAATLGPAPRGVAIERAIRTQPPEILDDGAVILRRLLRLPDPYEDLGAMLVRHAAWKVRELVGDGTATCVVLVAALVREGFRLLEAGHEANALRRGMDHGARTALGALERLSWQLESREAIAAVARTVAHDPDVAERVTEIQDVLGPDGFIRVELGHRAGLEHEYVAGSHWREGVLSPYFLNDSSKRAELRDPLILVTDVTFESAQDLLPVLEAVVEAGSRPLFVVARNMTGGALSLMVANHRSGRLELAAVRAPGRGSGQLAALEDLAALTGAHVLGSTTGRSPRSARLAELGQARMAWATTTSWGLVGGRGEPTLLRQRITEVRSEVAKATEPAERQNARQRLSNLLGGMAILRVGAPTKVEAEWRLATTQKTVAAVQAAVREGVVPGGGIGYLVSASAVVELALRPEERAGARLVAAALREPLRVLAANAGRDPAKVMARLTGKELDGWSFDAVRGELVEAGTGGPLDPLPVMREALRAAVSAADAALGTEVLVRPRRPERSLDP